MTITALFLVEFGFLWAKDFACIKYNQGVYQCFHPRTGAVLREIDERYVIFVDYSAE